MRHSLKLCSFIFTMIAIANACYSQDQKSAILSDQSTVNYVVNDQKQLEGPFSIYRTKDEVFLRGSYRNNMRSGNWYAFNQEGKVFMRYNYDLKKVLFIDTVSINRLNVQVATKDSQIREKASIPFPVCSIDQYISLLGTELKRLILQENKGADGNLNVELVADVSKDGKANYYGLYNANGVNSKKRLILPDNNFKIDWIPASYNGEKYAATFSVKASIDFRSGIPGRQRFLWVY